MKRMMMGLLAAACMFVGCANDEPTAMDLIEEHASETTEALVIPDVYDDCNYGYNGFFLNGVVGTQINTNWCPVTAMSMPDWASTTPASYPVFSQKKVAATNSSVYVKSYFPSLSISSTTLNIQVCMSFVDWAGTPKAGITPSCMVFVPNGTMQTQFLQLYNDLNAQSQYFGVYPHGTSHYGYYPAFQMKYIVNPTLANPIGTPVKLTFSAPTTYRLYHTPAGSILSQGWYCAQGSC